MSQAPKFWANKLPKSLRAKFWSLIPWDRGGYAERHLGLDGETAYLRCILGLEY